uniref:RNA-directed DNA polymerase n=1 Tax=Nicotiana tabacum TaxID=4097 RepID=A0A1S4DHJ7_TOBAC|nr:PREDICTED: uncharacterized protein LOC107829993 [Nicotiana tabacum]
MLERVLQNQEKFDTSMMNMIELVGSYTASIQKLEMQMRDLSREQNPKQKGTLPSDTIVNPKGSGSGPTSHVRAITTRSGKVLQGGREQVVEVEESEHKGEVEEPSVVESEKVPEELKVKQENREEVNEKISSIFATSTVQNKEDPGAFNIPCTIGAHYFARALCDNGSSINLMPLSIYKQAGLGMPSPTSMRLQTANHSIKRSVGIVDDVLVKVGKFHLPAKFVILDCAIYKEIPIILGRPFLATGRALMDSERNEIKFYVNDEEVTFHESKGMKLPHEYESISVIDVVNGVEDAVEMKMEEQCLGEALAAILVNFDGEDMEGYMELVNALEGLGSYTYAPVEQLLEVLKEHRQAIGWTIADIRGIPAGICEHKIQLESETKPSVEHQRRLNPYMQEVVMKEINKWLDVGVVYPIADSSWVSPVQCVPKRGGMTMIENDKYELIPTRTVNEWWVCMDYQKLNSATCKDHFCYISHFPIPPKTTAASTGHKSTKVPEREISYTMDSGPSEIMGSIEEDPSEDPYEPSVRVVSTTPVVDGDTTTSSLITEVKERQYKDLVLIHCRDNNLQKEKTPFEITKDGAFHQGFSKIANPMCKLLEKDAKFLFDKTCLKDFEELKQKLTAAPIIVTHNWSLPFKLMCDTSGVAIGAMLGQCHNKVLHSVYYSSKTLNGAQMNYMVTEQELLSIVYAFEKFRAYMLGSKVIVYRGHAALRYLMAKKDAKPRLILWVLLLQEFDFEVKDRKGTQNQVANHLSRLEEAGRPKGYLDINDAFPDEHILALSSTFAPWYADITNYLVSDLIPHGLESIKRRSF